MYVYEVRWQHSLAPFSASKLIYKKPLCPRKNNQLETEGFTDEVSVISLAIIVGSNKHALLFLETINSETTKNDLPGY